MHLDHVARRAGDCRHDRSVAPRQEIEQRGFSGIGRPDDGDAQALAQPLAAPVSPDAWRPLRPATRSPCERRRRCPRADPRRGNRSPPRDAPAPATPGAPRFVKAMQRPFHLLQSQPSLSIGLRRHQVGDALRRREVELAVLEGPAGEFARFGEATETRGDRSPPAPRSPRRVRHADAARPSSRRSRCLAPRSRRPGRDRSPRPSRDRESRAAPGAAPAAPACR